MKTFDFEVTGSTGAIYLVQFRAVDGQLYGACNCPAGELGQSCKHKMAILHGDATSVAAGADDVALIASLLPGTKLQAAILSVEEAESNLERAKKAVAAAKKQLGRIMSEE